MCKQDLSSLLDGINPMMHGLAQRSIDSGKYLDVMTYINGHQAVEYVYSHIDILYEHGLLEEFIVDAFIRHNWDNYAYYNELRVLFDLCSPALLQKASDPVPDGDTFKLYRGVTFLEWAYGYSWTGSLKVAQWFADRYKDRHKGFVVVRDTHRHEVLFYTNNRKEDEFIVDIEWINEDEWSVYEED